MDQRTKIHSPSPAVESRCIYKYIYIYNATSIYVSIIDRTLCPALLSFSQLNQLINSSSYRVWLLAMRYWSFAPQHYIAFDSIQFVFDIVSETTASDGTVTQQWTDACRQCLAPTARTTSCPPPTPLVEIDGEDFIYLRENDESRWYRLLQYIG